MYGASIIRVILRHNYLIIIFLSLFFIFHFTTPTDAADDEVYFFYPGNGNHRTNVFYAGEPEIELMIVFGMNCTNFSVESSSLLFLDELSDHYPNWNMTEGGSLMETLTINPDAPIGEYQINIYVNYSDTTGNPIDNLYLISLHYARAFEIIDIDPPNRPNDQFSIELYVHENLTRLIVEFDSDGNTQLDNRREELSNLKEGYYNFSTSISQDFLSIGGDQEVGYHIIGYIDNRFIEYSEKNIEVSVKWGSLTNNESIDRTLIVILILVIILVLINLFYLKKRRKKN